MLLNLHVKNLAIIDEVDVEFKEGLNILTGETGAGKSIIIGSINLALGAKLKGDIVRQGCDHALVQLVFSINDSIKERLLDYDIAVDEDEVIITRKISSNGRSTCKINSQIVTVSALAEIASLLIDIHGQHDNQLLLNKKNHLDIVDDYGKEEISTYKEQVYAIHKEYKDVQRQLDELNVDEDKKNREISLCRYELDEINNAKLIHGEDEDIEAQYKKLSASTEIMEGLSLVSEIMEEGNNNVADGILRAIKSLGNVVKYDDNLEQLSNMLLDIQALISDFNGELSSYVDNVDSDPATFMEVEKRLDLINLLKSKYGKTIEDILKYGEECAKRLELLENQDQHILMLKSKQKELYKDMECKSDTLSSLRKKWADSLCDKIRESLKELNFLDVRFEPDFVRTLQISNNGYDDFQFLISTNPGQALAPLTKIASGGELSRVMLSIKSVMSDSEEVETQIFDEIDSGISGRTAQMVAEKLSVIGSNRQVICITHLAQIAAMADSHYLIEKSAKDGNTNTLIRPLKDEEIIDELARILGGAQITQATIDSAKEMKEMANQLKQKNN
ncbi:MAG: DNA repair protein RecN [Lachnospiraceae bacterium]|nr:DNA repair protein RecN [Lachnospiraceae bacterium]